MPDIKPLVLIVQPVRLQGLIWQAVLKSQGISVIWESADIDFADNIRQLKAANLALPHLLIVDVSLEDFNPFAFCRLCRSDYPDMQVLLTHSGRQELVPSERQWAVNQGAADFIPGFQVSSLVTDVTSAVKRVLEILGDQPLDNGALISVLFSIKRQLDNRQSRTQAAIAQNPAHSTSTAPSRNGRKAATAMDSSPDNLVPTEDFSDAFHQNSSPTVPSPETSIPPSSPSPSDADDEDPPPVRRYRGVSY